MDMVSTPWKHFVEAYSHQFLTQILRRGSGSLGAHQGKETGVRNERWNRLFIGKVCHQLFDKAANIRWSLHSGPKGVSYVQVLPKGYSKK